MWVETSTCTLLGRPRHATPRRHQGGANTDNDSWSINEFDIDGVGVALYERYRAQLALPRTMAGR